MCLQINHPITNTDMSFLTQIISSGTQYVDSHLESRRIRIINIFLLSSSVIVFAFGCMNAILQLPILIIIDSVLGIILISGIILNHLHHWPVTRFMIVYFLPFYFLLFPGFFGDIGTEYYNFAFLILGFYLLDKRASMIFLSIYITAIFMLSKYLLFNLNYGDKYKILEQVHYYPSVFAALAVIASAIAVFKKDTTKYQSDLLEQKKTRDKQVMELREKDRFNREITQELNHRVKNNIQLISGLITLQTYSSKNQEVVRT